MKPSHFTLTLALLVLVSCASLYPEPEQTDSERLIEHFSPVLVDAGLSSGLYRLRGLTVKVHPGSDGGSWSIEPMPYGKLSDGGTYYLNRLFDEGSAACASYPGERVLWVASLDSPYVGHGFAHVARTDDVARLRDGGVMCADRNGDHDYFNSVQLDAKCGEVARGNN